MTELFNAMMARARLAIAYADLVLEDQEAVDHYQADQRVKRDVFWRDQDYIDAFSPRWQRIYGGCDE